MEELVSHANVDVFQTRVDLRFSLPYLTFSKNAGHVPGEPFAGCVADVRHFEIAFLMAHPGASHQVVIDAVWLFVRGGFASGEQFVRENMDWWRFFRRFLAKHTRLRKEDVANVTHFPTTDPKEALPPKGQSATLLSVEASEKHFERLASALAARISESGDSRNLDPKTTASNLMREAFEETLPLRSAGPGFMDAMLERDSVSRDRLPPSPTVEDMCYEAVFVAQMGVSARRLLVSRDQLVRLVRKEHLPSWLIWEQVDRRMKQFKRAEIGNVNDKYMLSFGPYVDVLNVDKRIAELLRQAAGESTLLNQIYRRVPTGRGLAGLIDRLKTPLPQT